MKSRLPAWLLVLFVALLATGTDEFVIAGVLQEVAADLGVSVSAAGQLVTVFAVVYALGAPAVAVLTDRLTRRTVIIVGLTVFAIANAAAAVGPGYWTLMGSRVLAALAAAAVTSTAFATAAAGAPDGRQGRFLAVVTAGMTVALFTGVPVGTFLGGSYGWRATFWLIASVGAVAALAALATVPHIAGGQPAPLAERLRPLRSPAVFRLVSVTFLAGSGGLMFYSYLGPYTAEVSSDSYLLRTVVLLIVGVAGIGGALLGGRSSDTWGPARSLRVVVGGHAVALFVAAALAFSGLHQVVVLGLVVALWSVFAWAFNPPIQGSMLAAAPQAPMPALALNISGLYLGTGIAGALGGVIISTIGVTFVPLAAGILLLASLSLTPQPSGAREPAGAPDRVESADTTRLSS